MKTFHSNTLFLAVTGSILLLSIGISEAQSYRGKVKLRGVLVQRGQITEMSVNLEADRMVASNGDEIRMNAGGFYSRDSADVTGKYRGYLKRITSEYGNVKRQRQNNRVTVSRRAITFRDGRIRLRRPLNVNRPGRHRLRGEGRFTVRA